MASIEELYNKSEFAKVGKSKNDKTPIDLDGGKDLSNEEKKIIYRQSFKDTNDKLSAIFSKEEIKTVNALLKEQNQKKK